MRQLLGVTGQYASVDENLTATENLMLFGRLLGLSKAEARERAATLLAQFGAGGRRRTGRSPSSPAACAAGSTSRSA